MPTSSALWLQCSSGLSYGPAQTRPPSAPLYDPSATRSFGKRREFRIRLFVLVCFFLAYPMEPYQYRPLDDQDIRLLELFPGSDREITCSLRHVQPSAANYEAISYCWGDPTDKKHIICDGKTIAVTRNLYSFLLHSRHQSEIRSLWADAVCINQKDDAEVASQVGRMGEIYSRAQRVLAWLGPGSEGSDDAMSLVNLLSGVKWFPHNDGTWIPADPNTVPSDEDPVWLRLAELFRREYFQRLWIIQEVALARMCTVVCGTSSAPWDALNWAASQLWRVLGVNRGLRRSPTIRASIQPITAIDKARRQGDTFGLQRTLSLLSRHRSAKTSDNRDRIYGLFGILPNEFEDLGIRPRYDINTSSLYLQVAMAMLKKSQNLDIFSIPRSSKVDTAEQPLPSWVPDWTHHTEVRSLLGLENPGEAKPHVWRASRCPQWEPAFSPDGQLLQLQGYCVDTITKSVLVDSSGSQAEWPDDLTRIQNLRLLARRLKDEEDLLTAMERATGATSKKPHRLGDSMMQVYMGTRMAGTTEDGWTWAEEAFRKYRASRRVTGWLHPLSHVLPLHLMLVLIRTYQSKESTLEPNMDFLPDDKSAGRQIFRTKEGYIGLGPPMAAVGDRIAICKGGKLPLILRKDNENWELIGDSYIYGMVKGELWEEEKCEPIWIQ